MRIFMAMEEHWPIKSTSYGGKKSIVHLAISRRGHTTTTASFSAPRSVYAHARNGDAVR